MANFGEEANNDSVKEWKTAPISIYTHKKEEVEKKEEQEECDKACPDENDGVKGRGDKPETEAKQQTCSRKIQQRILGTQSL